MKRSELKSKIEEVITELLSEEGVAWSSGTKANAKKQIDTSKLDSKTKQDAKAEIDQNPSGLINNL